MVPHMIAWIGFTAQCMISPISGWFAANRLGRLARGGLEAGWRHSVDGKGTNSNPQKKAYQEFMEVGLVGGNHPRLCVHSRHLHSFS
jgi:hypothetical protein